MLVGVLRDWDCELVVEDALERRRIPMLAIAPRMAKIHLVESGSVEGAWRRGGGTDMEASVDVAAMFPPGLKKSLETMVTMTGGGSET